MQPLNFGNGLAILCHTYWWVCHVTSMVKARHTFSTILLNSMHMQGRSYISPLLRYTENHNSRQRLFNAFIVALQTTVGLCSWLYPGGPGVSPQRTTYTGVPPHGYQAGKRTANGGRNSQAGELETIKRWSLNKGTVIWTERRLHTKNLTTLKMPYDVLG